MEFVLIGGVAAIAHGSATFTVDCDITAPFSEENLARLLAALAKNRNLHLLTDLGRLDLISEVPPVGSHAEVASRAVTLDVYGRPCRIISLDDLIAVKRHLGRDKDRLVERELLALRNRKKSTEH